MSNPVSARAEAAARTIWNAWSTGAPLDRLPDNCLPTDLEEAYASQAALDDLAGRRAGWKLAATGPAGRASLGVDHPLVGPLYDHAFRDAGGPIAVDSTRVGAIEAEMGFMVARDLPAPGAPYDREAVVAALGPIVPAFELPNTRYASSRDKGAAQLIADAACAGIVVLGTPIPDYDPAALPGVAVTLETAGGSASGTGANVLGDPVEAMVWAANQLASQGRALCEGDVVITGAIALVGDLRPGPVTATYAGLGQLTISLV